MTPLERLAMWSGLGFIIGITLAWATDSSLPRILAWGAILGTIFGAVVLIRCATDAAERRMRAEENSYRDISPTRSRNDVR